MNYDSAFSTCYRYPRRLRSVCVRPALTCPRRVCLLNYFRGFRAEKELSLLLPYSLRYRRRLLCCCLPTWALVCFCKGRPFGELSCFCMTELSDRFEPTGNSVAVLGRIFCLPIPTYIETVLAGLWSLAESLGRPLTFSEELARVCLEGTTIKFSIQHFYY